MSTHAAPRRTLSLSLAALATTALLLTGCSGTGDDPSPTATDPSTTSASPSTEPSASATSASPSPTEESSSSATTTPGASPGTGCPAAGDGVPQGASSTEIIDVDGDGRPDTAWLTGGADRTFGITTASGATFFAPIDSASPIPASAVVGSVVASGAGNVPVALVDLGREALVFSLAECQVVQSLDSSGQPFTFDRGFGDQGTGVGCSDTGIGTRLAGLLAEQNEDGTWTVKRTYVDLGNYGRLANSGSVETVTTDAAADDPAVTTAQEVSCGDLVAGAGGLTEPGGA